MIESLSIFGSGGHAKVVIEIAQLNGLRVDSIYDDDFNKADSIVCGIKVKVPIDYSLSSPSIVSIGNNVVRKRIVNNIINAQWYSLIHPTAIISKDVVIGEGTVIMAGVIIQTGVKIGNHCIINTGSCIDHDTIIGNFVHVAPNSSLAGGITIGEGAFIGIGSSIIPNVVIGNWTTIGAGSVVINNQPDNCVSVGVPAKPIKLNNE